MAADGKLGSSNTAADGNELRIVDLADLGAVLDLAFVGYNMERAIKVDC